MAGSCERESSPAWISSVCQGNMFYRLPVLIFIQPYIFLSNNKVLYGFDRVITGFSSKVSSVCCMSCIKLITNTLKK